MLSYAQPTKYKTDRMVEELKFATENDQTVFLLVFYTVYTITDCDFVTL